MPDKGSKRGYVFEDSLSTGTGLAFACASLSSTPARFT